MAARKSKWSLVKTHIDNGNIKQWKRSMTEKQIATACGVSYPAFNNYKNQYPELQEALQDGDEELCVDLKSALIKKALGYDVEEKSTHIKENPDGTKTKEVKVTTKHIPADTGAIHLLLKNKDELWHNDDAIILEMKKQELELKKQLAAKEEQIIELTSSLNDLLNIVGSDNSGTTT